jgi:hypothetical protein
MIKIALPWKNIGNAHHADVMEGHKRTDLNGKNLGLINVFRDSSGRLTFRWFIFTGDRSGTVITEDSSSLKNAKRTVDKRLKLNGYKLMSEKSKKFEVMV